MKRTIEMILFLFAGLTLFSCSGEAGSSKRSSGEIFASAMEAIHSYYIFSAPSRNELEQKVRQEINAPAEVNLDSWIQEQSGDSRPEITKMALHALMRSLPKGDNDVLTPEALAFANDTTKTDGIGMVLKIVSPGKYMVMDTLEGSPSYREELPLGSYLEAVDGKKVSEMSGLSEVVARIKGPASSPVKLTLNGKDYELRRGNSPFKHFVSSTWKAGNKSIEYIVLRSTLPGAADEMKQFLLSMEARSQILLDLRKLHNGDFAETFKVADLFVTEKKMGSLVTKETGKQEFIANSDQIFTGPVGVLLGRDPAPFSGILALAMSLSPQVRIAGGKWNGEAFLARNVPLPGGYQMRITTGYIEGPDQRPTYETGYSPHDVIDPGFPLYSPLNQPNPADPGQMKLRKLFQLSFEVRKRIFF